MASAAITTRPEVVEVRMSMPNKHHFVVDLSPFGLANDNEVFHADDRPYGLIEAAVLDDGAPDPGPAWTPTRCCSRTGPGTRPPPPGVRCRARWVGGPGGRGSSGSPRRWWTWGWP